MVRSAGVGLLLALISVPGFGAQWSGIVDWAQRTELSTPLSGVVARVEVNAGDRVKKGQLLLQLEQAALSARLNQRKAEMQHGELMLKEARKELERAEELYERTLLADHDLDVAKIDYAQADAAYQAILADYQQAREDHNNSSLHAPFDAIVLARNIQPAQTVNSRCEAQPLLTLAPSTRMRVRIFVESDKLESIRNNHKMNVEVSGQSYSAEVVAIGYEPEIVKESIHYPVDVVFASGELELIGQGAKVNQ